MSRLRVALLGILVVCIGLAGFRVYQQKVQDDEQAAQLAAAATKAEAHRAAQAEFARKMAERPRADRSMMEAVSPAYPRPPSDWLASEKAAYAKLVAGGKFETLVIPFQVQEYAIDRATRSLMTAELALALSQVQQAQAPDPYLVARALGDGQRRLNPEDVYRLANAVGAKRLVWGYVGHNRTGAMAITIQAQDRPENMSGSAAWSTPMATKSFESITIGDEVPPIERYEALLPELLRALGVDPGRLQTQKLDSKLEIPGLPASPMDLLKGEPSPARDAYTFLLFGLLTPAAMERTREIFAEKALLALSQMSATSPEYRVLRARAYLALGYRLAALKVLGTPETSEELELHAVLNGNLADVRKHAIKEKNTLKRVMQEIDENRISAAYGLMESQRAEEKVKALRLPGNVWPYLTLRALAGADVWSQFDNAQLKQLLDYELPVKGYGLEELVRGAGSVGDERRLRTTVDLSVFNHRQKYLEADAGKWCCQTTAPRPGALDYLELLQAIGHDNLIRRIAFLVTVQGRPDAAMDYANSIETVYKGYPYYTLNRARAQVMLAGKSDGAAKEGLLKAGYKDAFNAMYWEQAQTHTSADAFNLISNTGQREYGYFDNMFAADVPYRPYYPTWADGGNPQSLVANGEAALKNATVEFWLIGTLSQHYRNLGQASSPDEFLARLEGRFLGNPARVEFMATREIQRGDHKTAAALYRENIQFAPGYFQSYRDLGKLLFESGDEKEASRVFSSYPGFRKGSGENRVSIANRAYETGSLFFWFGDYEHALPLYRIASVQETGASSEITSALRLRLLAGDIPGALEGTAMRAQRYGESYAYRDYFSMLHATGHSADAWSGFSTIARQLQQPHIWESALVGHHMGRLSEAEVSAWARQEEFKGGLQPRSYPATHLLRFATMDRMPSKDLSTVLDALDPPTWQIEGRRPGKTVVRPSNGGKHEVVLGPITGWGQYTLPIGVFGPSTKVRVKSDLAYFADGYRAIRLADFAAAKAAFDEAATLYDMASVHSSYMLPYYALAAAKAGDTAGVESIFGRYGPEEQRFDFHLAKAILAAVAGNNSEALQHLTLARYRRPHTEYRPLLTQYTYGEISEWLADMTKDGKIRDLALDWARKSQRFEPWHAWGYAIEARLTTKPADRKRALAMVSYLDKHSERLAAFKASDLQDAVKTHSNLNPFLRKADAAARAGTI